MVGIKLLLEFLYSAGHVEFENNKWLSVGPITITFAAAYIHARRKGPVRDVNPASEEARDLLSADPEGERLPQDTEG